MTSGFKLGLVVLGALALGCAVLLLFQDGSSALGR